MLLNHPVSIGFLLLRSELYECIQNESKMKRELKQHLIDDVNSSKCSNRTQDQRDQVLEILLKL